MKAIIEPCRIKSVQPIRITIAEQRRRHLLEASCNLFRILARTAVTKVPGTTRTPFAHFMVADSPAACTMRET